MDLKLGTRYAGGVSPRPVSLNQNDIRNRLTVPQHKLMARTTGFDLSQALFEVIRPANRLEDVISDAMGERMRAHRVRALGLK